jgi:hypothetical protein
MSNARTGARCKGPTKMSFELTPEAKKIIESIDFHATGGAFVNDEEWPHFYWSIALVRIEKSLHTIYKTGVAHHTLKGHHFSFGESYLSPKKRKAAAPKKAHFFKGKFWLEADRNERGKSYRYDIQPGANASASIQLIPTPPNLLDVLHSLLLDASTVEYSFRDWCADYGYSNDSIKALSIFRACEEIAEKLKKFFTNEEIATLNEALQDY